MFSTAATSDYADVFSINPEIDSGFMTFMLIFAGVGILTIFVGSMMGEEGGLLLLLGGALAIGGIIGCWVQNSDSLNARQELIQNMSSNIEDKYGAELKTDGLPEELYENLDKAKSYTLTFENGSTAEYKMFFQKSGEPMMVEDVAAPTVQELNGSEKTTPKKTPAPEKSESPVKMTEPATAPTPSELEEAAKK